MDVVEQTPPKPQSWSTLAADTAKTVVNIGNQNLMNAVFPVGSVSLNRDVEDELSVDE